MSPLGYAGLCGQDKVALGGPDRSHFTQTQLRDEGVTCATSKVVGRKFNASLNRSHMHTPSDSGLGGAEKLGTELEPVEPDR